MIDADTVEIHGKRIRLTGIDATGARHKRLDATGAFYFCGSLSATALDQWIGTDPMTCAQAGRDDRDRMLAECSLRGANVQDRPVGRGHAIAYRSCYKAYGPQEFEPRRPKTGVWAGQLIEPWNWRRGHRLPSERPTRAMRYGAFAPAGSAPEPREEIRAKFCDRLCGQPALPATLARHRRRWRRPITFHCFGGFVRPYLALRLSWDGGREAARL